MPTSSRAKPKSPAKNNAARKRGRAPATARLVNAPTPNGTLSAATQIAINVRTSLPALSEPARRAFLGQTTLAERQALGERTKAPGVLHEAGGWISIIAAARAKFGEAAIRYGALRLAYLCESALGVADTIAAARQKRTGVVRAGSLREGALASARAVRDDLLHALEQVTRGHADAKLVSDVERDLAHDDQLTAALDKLAELVSTWVARAAEDEGVAALVAGAGLTADDATRATAAGAALASAGAGRAEAGSARPQDPPEVNAAEGALLAEMRVARDAFAAAHARNPAIPRLIPGAATRAVLGTHARRAKEAPAAPAPAPTP